MMKTRQLLGGRHIDLNSMVPHFKQLIRNILQIFSRFRSAIAKGRYRKDLHMQNSMRKLKLTLTATLTLADTGGAD